MPPDIFDLIEDTSDVSEVSNLITYISSVRSIIVERKEPYFTLVKNNIKNNIRDEFVDEATESYKEEMLNRLYLLKSKFTSEFKQNTVDIFIEYVNSDNGVLNKESLIFLNQIWKNQV